MLVVVATAVDTSKVETARNGFAIAVTIVHRFEYVHERVSEFMFWMFPCVHTRVHVCMGYSYLRVDFYMYVRGDMECGPLPPRLPIFDPSR